MRLINIETLTLEEFLDENEVEYGILSHRWARNEVTFLDMQKVEDQTHKEGWTKVVSGCQQAQADGLRYFWCDTCCINKESTAELSEAINSMFRWYQRSAACYVYLEDVKNAANLTDHDLHQQIASSVWFSRGWTLQELIAPRNMKFLDQNWSYLGDKRSLCDMISTRTGIQPDILDGGSVENCSVAQRMSWAAHRATTRPEDMAYCLLGIFDVNMPLLYGEGKKAFIRLQEEIIKHSDDHSIFVWPMQGEVHLGLLAESPDAFSGCGLVTNTPWRKHLFPFAFETQNRTPFAITNRGLSITLDAIPFRTNTYLVALDCYTLSLTDTRKGDRVQLGIFLQRLDEHDQYARVACSGTSVLHFSESNPPWSLSRTRLYSRSVSFFVRQVQKTTGVLPASEDMVLADNGIFKLWATGHTCSSTRCSHERGARCATLQWHAGRPSVLLRSTSPSFAFQVVKLVIDLELNCICILYLKRSHTVSLESELSHAALRIKRPWNLDFTSVLESLEKIDDLLDDANTRWVSHHAFEDLKLSRGWWVLKGDPSDGFRFQMSDLGPCVLIRQADKDVRTHWEFRVPTSRANALESVSSFLRVNT